MSVVVMVESFLFFSMRACNFIEHTIISHEGYHTGQLCSCVLTNCSPAFVSIKCAPKHAQPILSGHILPIHCGCGGQQAIKRIRALPICFCNDSLICRYGGSFECRISSGLTDLVQWSMIETLYPHLCTMHRYRALRCPQNPLPLLLWRV